MQIYVGGSLRDVPNDEAACRTFVNALGVAVVRQGHILLNGCRSSLDLEIAEAAAGWLEDNDRDNLGARLVSYRLKRASPIHSLGTVRESQLEDWDMNHPELEVPEQIGRADATVFVAGAEGTYWARNWATLAGTPILGIPRFGGAASNIYYKELKRYQERTPDLADDYEMLNSLSDDASTLADRAVSLAERLVTPSSVFTIMSFKSAYLDVYDSYRDVCAEFKFDAERTDHSTSLDRIIARIESGIRNCAFVIADVSEPSQNIFYELGYAKGLGKKVVVTAKKGTELPFDVTDIPVIWWKRQRDLKEGLRQAIKALAEAFGR